MGDERVELGQRLNLLADDLGLHVAVLDDQHRARRFCGHVHAASPAR